MKRSLVAVLAILLLPAVGLGGTHTSNVPLYGFALKGTELDLTREVMAINWTNNGSAPTAFKPPTIVLGKTIFMKPSPGESDLLETLEISTRVASMRRVLCSPLSKR